MIERFVQPHDTSVRAVDMDQEHFSILSKGQMKEDFPQP